MSKKDSFPIITTAHLDKLLQLSQQDRDELITAILLYAKDKTISELKNPLIEYLFNDFIQDFDERRSKYEDKCVKLRSNASKGGRQKKAIATNCYQLLPNATPATADSPSTPNNNKFIKEEIISKEVNTQSDNILSNDNNYLPSYNDSPPNNIPPPNIPYFTSKTGDIRVPPQLSDEGGKSGAEAPPKPPHIDFDKLRDYWNAAMRGKAIKPIKLIGERGQRRERLQARTREYGKDAIRQAIDKAAASDFLNGKNNKGWVATFDWLILPNNFPKVIEGNYDNDTRKDMQHEYTTVNAFPNRWEQQQIERQQRHDSYARLINGLLAEAEEDPCALVNQLRAQQNVPRDQTGADSEP